MTDSAGFGAFTQRELRSLAKTFQVMGDEAVDKSKAVAYEISQISKREIAQAGYSRTVSAKGVRRVVDGASISRTSKTGRLSYGLAGQRFSGGGSTKILWRGLEFGSNGTLDSSQPSAVDLGRGSRGYFIFPTLRKIQPELTLKYIKAMNDAVKGWSK
jgi:hypothetical protein